MGLGKFFFGKLLVLGYAEYLVIVNARSSLVKGTLTLELFVGHFLETG